MQTVYLSSLIQTTERFKPLNKQETQDQDILFQLAETLDSGRVRITGWVHQLGFSEYSLLVLESDANIVFPLKHVCELVKE